MVVARWILFMSSNIRIDTVRRVCYVWYDMALWYLLTSKQAIVFETSGFIGYGFVPTSKTDAVLGSYAPGYFLTKDYSPGLSFKTSMSGHWGWDSRSAGWKTGRRSDQCVSALRQGMASCHYLFLGVSPWTNPVPWTESINPLKSKIQLWGILRALLVLLHEWWSRQRQSLWLADTECACVSGICGESISIHWTVFGVFLVKQWIENWWKR